MAKAASRHHGLSFVFCSEWRSHAKVPARGLCRFSLKSLLPSIHPSVHPYRHTRRQTYMTYRHSYIQYYTIAFGHTPACLKTAHERRTTASRSCCISRNLQILFPIQRGPTTQNFGSWIYWSKISWIFLARPPGNLGSTNVNLSDLRKTRLLTCQAWEDLLVEVCVCM